MNRLLLILATLGCLVVPSAAQEVAAPAGGCDEIDAAVFATPGSVPDFLLDTPGATNCLMGALTTLSQREVDGQLSTDDNLALLRATGALGKIIAKGQGDPIARIREADSIAIVDLLAYGAKSTDYDTRANTTNLLTNIIDNSTVCVVMDHLADPTLSASEDGFKGRAALLATVSVVAPWATKSNYENMKQLSGYLDGQVDVGKAPKTGELLKNFDERLDYQGTLPVEKANKNFENAGSLTSCQNYTPRWATSGAFVLHYPAQ
jgi:hypothetical protein